MKKTLRAFALVLVLLAPAAATQTAESPLLLVRDGRPAAIILTPSNREWGKHKALILSERQAAACLQGHLLQISGARLDVVDERTSGARVLEGRIAAPNLNERVENFILVGGGMLAEALGVTGEDLGPGGMRIKTVGNALVLMGHPEISHPVSDGGGVRAAVRAFLESLGCRYLWPGESGKVIPSMSTVTVKPTDIAYTPPIGQRRIRHTTIRSRRVRTGLSRLGISEETYGRLLSDANRTRVDALVEPGRYVRTADLSWLTWHGIGGDIGIGGGHAFGDAWERWGKDHPDWFALQPDGTRDQSAAGNRERLCVSNLGLQDAIAQDILSQASKRPEKRCFSICPNDGGYANFCLCDACRALDPEDAPKIQMLIFEKVGQSRRKAVDYVSLTDRYVYFWNQIAKRVTRDRPDLLLLIQAYSVYQHAPVRRRLHSSLVLRYVPSDATEWKGWQDAGARMVYWRPNILIRGRRRGDVLIYAASMADTFHHLFRNGMVATDMDSVMDNWAGQGLNYYVAARLNWDPALTYDAILDDFCNAGFGKAAPHVRRYFVAAEKAWTEQLQKHPRAPYFAEAVAGLRSHMQAAFEAAGGDRAVLRRLAFLNLGLNYTDLHSTIGRIAEAVESGKPYDKGRVRRLLDLNYLTLRDIALNHTLAVNTPCLMWGTGDFARWQKIGGRGYRARDELLRRVNEEKLSLTGLEKSLDEMLAVFRLTE